jgi:hypothetical protein
VKTCSAFFIVGGTVKMPPLWVKPRFALQNVAAKKANGADFRPRRS